MRVQACWTEEGRNRLRHGETNTGQKDVSHLRRLGFVGVCAQPLRAGLSSGAPAVLG